MTDGSDSAKDTFETALETAKTAGEAATAGTGDAAVVLVSSTQITIRKPDKAEFFYPLWSIDLQLLHAKDGRGTDIYAMLAPEAPDIDQVKRDVADHLKKVRFVYCVGTNGARFLMPAAHSDTTWFRSFCEFTEMIAPNHTGPFKRISDIQASQYRFLEAREPKPFDAGPEHKDQTAILRSVLQIVSSKGDPLVKRLLGIGL